MPLGFRFVPLFPPSFRRPVLRATRRQLKYSPKQYRALEKQEQRRSQTVPIRLAAAAASTTAAAAAATTATQPARRDGSC